MRVVCTRMVIWVGPIVLAAGLWALAGLSGPVMAVEPAASDLALAATATPTRRAPTPTPVRQREPTPTPQEETESTANPEPTLTTTALAYPVPDDQPADYPLQSGHFFSQAVPGAPPGFGFTVADAAGIPFWSEYQRLGGLEKLGYPVSRRFALGGDIVQAFQIGLLRWQPGTGQAELVPLTVVGEVLAEAVEPEPPARLGSWAAHQPWSGWWWPATTSVGGPHLFDANGPLAKYDQYIAANGHEAPGTLAWERSELQLAGVAWAGHCNGWAAAALLEPEPAEPITSGGVTFSVADQKGLLSAYHFADAAAWLHGGDDLMPIDFHTALVDWLGRGKKGFVMTFRPAANEEVWSYPVYRFELTVSPDPVDANVTHVQATVWLSDNNVPADYIGVRPWKGDGQIYEYKLYGPRAAPVWADWEGVSVPGRFARPYLIWYPDPEHRNIDRALASPNLDYKAILQIMKRA